LIRLWESHSSLDAYALVHLASAAGDALVAIALADSVFFSLPVGQAKIRVALYLALTMAPLAVAAPILIPLLDRGGFRRAISFGAAAGRAALAMYAAPRASTLVLFPVAFGLLVLSKVHGVTKNGLTGAYAEPDEGLVRANGRLGRVAVAGGALAAGPGIALAATGGSTPVLYLAAAAYGVGALLTLRLVRPEEGRSLRGGERGRQALGFAPVAAATLRGASGFLLFLLAFALRRSGQPASWYAVLGAAAVGGGFVADVVAPRIPQSLREEAMLGVSLVVAGVAALAAFRYFDLPVLALFAFVAGMATEIGRLAFQSLMQARTPEGMQGRVFVRYEVLFQLAWVAGAFVAAVLPVSIGTVSIIPLSFRGGVLILGIAYLGLGIVYATAHPQRRRADA
ncbi:MAG TPA: hypothetical protein VKA30_11205, partial [Actinomycetota bacterium]|nr:hypothetical protein [Actinomycetota bacterium]